MSTPSATALLRGAGLRVTAPRVAVLEILAEHPHADATEVLHLARERARGVSVQGVYDVLSTLTRHRLLRRIQPAHSVARFEIDHGDNHHHVVCRRCQDIVDVPCAVGAAPCLDDSPVAALGYQVDEAEVIYWGICATCRDADEAAPVATAPALAGAPHTGASPAP